MELIEYIEKYYPEKIKEYERFSTPHYYEPGPLYRSIVSGFGESSPGRKNFIIKEARYLSDDIYLHLKDPKDPISEYSVSLFEAHTKLERVNDERPIGLFIPNSKEDLMIEVGGRKYEIHQAYWRGHSDNRLGGRVVVWCEEDEPEYGKKPHYELYSHFGSKWHLKHVYSYDSMRREIYKIKFDISVREFKNIVFGDSNVKFVHESEELLFNRAVDNRNKKEFNDCDRVD